MRPGLTLYVIRHGETDWNAERRYQGQCDIPMNVRGIEQSHRNGMALRAHLPEIAAARFISSPLGRARQTMEIVRAALALDPGAYEIENRLQELSYGTWEGQLQSELPRRDPEGVRARARDPLRWRPDGGESYADLSQRTADWLSTVERDAVIATHGGVMRCLYAHVLAVDPREIPELACPQDKVLRLTHGAAEWI